MSKEKYVFLYNSLSSSGKDVIKAENLPLKSEFKERIIDIQDYTKIENMSEFILSLDNDTFIILSGGDGTLNSFINKIDKSVLERKIYFLGHGTGNDFLKDINHTKMDEPVLLNDYIFSLPTVKVNGKELKFINGVGLGLDGYVCCDIDTCRKNKPKKRLSYVKSALKGILYAFKKQSAEIEIDGEKYSFNNVYLCSSMIGKYFGGGMKMSPLQDRLNDKKTLTFSLAHDLNKFTILTLFAKIFKGNHTKHKKVFIRFANHIKVKFSKPSFFQIDGEPIFSVLEYEIKF